MGALLRWLDPVLNPLACLPSAPENAFAMENAEAMINRLELLLRQKLKYAMAGEQKGSLRGQGLDFADLREYRPGDDIRKMDWSVFARTMTPHVREYHEEKQLTLWLAVDLTPSMVFGRQKTKLAHAIDLFGLFALLAQKAGHKLGAYLIGANQTEIVAPGMGPGHSQHLTQKLLWFQEAMAKQPTAPHNPDPLPEAWQALSRVVTRQNRVIVISDFLTASRSPNPQWQSALGQIAQKATLLSLLLVDPVETALPEKLGLLTLKDPETGHTIRVDTNDSRCLHAYARQAQHHQQETLDQLKNLGPAVLATTGNDPMDTLLALLAARRHPL